MRNEGGPSWQAEKVIIVDPRSLRLDKLQPVTAFAHRIWVRHTLIFGVLAILFAAIAYITATQGLSAVVRCEVETNATLGHAGNAASQIALSNACGF